MLCGKQYEEHELKSKICRSCNESVRREATGGKLKEKKAADREIRSSGQASPDPTKG
jgi:hypothetical protein